MFICLYLQDASSERCMMSDIHLHNNWRWWRGLNSDSFQYKSHLKELGGANRALIASLSTTCAFPDIKANNHQKADFKATLHTLGFMTPGMVVQSQRTCLSLTEIQLKLVFLQLVVFMLNYSSKNRIAVRSLGASWENNDGIIPIWY